jgi:carboxypeptidase PM20D1
MKRLLQSIAALLLPLVAVIFYRSMALNSPAYHDIAPMDIDIGSDLRQVARNLAGAVQIRTVSTRQSATKGAQGFNDFQRYLRTTYPLVHQRLQLSAFNTHALLYHWPGSNSKLEPILLLGHYDTVPVIAGTETQWTYPPFAGAIADGFVWGRGTLDDKGMIIAQMDTVEQLLREGHQPARSIYLAYGHDEEIGGRQGALKISQHLQQQDLRFSLVLDEGSIIAVAGVIAGLDRPVALLGHAEKGYLTVKVTAHDAGGHSSMPPAHTAAGRIAAAVTQLENRQLPANLEHNVDFFAGILPFLPLAQRIALSNSWLFKPLLVSYMEKQPALNASLRTTTAVTMLSASPKENVLPIEASAVVNYRIMPGESVASTLDHARRAVAGTDTTVQALGSGTEPSPVAPIDGFGYRLLQQSVREAWHDDSLLVTPRLVLVTTDTRHYHPLADEVFRFMPNALTLDEVAGIHGTDERLSLENLELMLRFYRRLIINADRSP